MKQRVGVILQKSKLLIRRVGDDEVWTGEGGHPKKNHDTCFGLVVVTRALIQQVKIRLPALAVLIDDERPSTSNRLGRPSTRVDPGF